jgi:hypothetical protein
MFIPLGFVYDNNILLQGLPFVNHLPSVAGYLTNDTLAL